MHPLDIFHYCPNCGSNEFTIFDDRSKKCARCGFHYYINVSASVAAFITDDKGRLLLCKRAKNPEKGTLDLPGGFVDFNETAEDALKREIKEELNIEVNDIKFLFSLPNTYPFSQFTVHTLDMFYLIKIDSKISFSCADDVENAQFYDRSEIDIDKIGLSSIKKAVEIALRKHIF
jgi:mutator protein MutT